MNSHWTKVNKKITIEKTNPTFAANFLGGAYTEIGVSFKSLTINFESSARGDSKFVNPRIKKSIARKRATHSLLKKRM